MRYMYFDQPHARDIYEMLYDGIVNAPRGYDKNEVRVISKVYDKLEEIGKAVERNGRTTYELAQKGLFIVIEEVELSLVNSALGTIRWIGTHARLASELFDWLDNLPTQEKVSATS